MDADAPNRELTEPEAADPLHTALAWRQAGRRVAIATVVKTWGSAPLPVGSQLVVDEHADFVGSISGGCIEGAVIEEALAILQHGEPKLLNFGVTSERAWEVGLSCGGDIEVFVEPIA